MPPYAPDRPIPLMLQDELDRTTSEEHRLGLHPGDLQMQGPLVVPLSPFKVARKGVAARQAAWRKDEEEAGQIPEIQLLDDAAWLKLQLELQLPSTEELLKRPWNDVAGPFGVLGDVIGQALQLQVVAMELAQTVGLAAGQTGEGFATSWASRTEEAWGALEVEVIRRLGLEELRVFSTAAAVMLQHFSVLCGFGGMTRDPAAVGRPRDIPFVAFVAWLTAAGATAMEIGVIGGLLGIRTCKSREDGARAVRRAQRGTQVAAGEHNPVRFLASLAIQRQERSSAAEAPPVESGLPRLPYPYPETAPPAPSWQGEWVMVPVPAWSVGAFLTTAAMEDDRRNG